MTKTKTLLMAALAAGTMFAAAPAYADLKMGVAAEPYAPFTSKDASGKWVGWEVDFMNALCADIGEKCAIEEVAWDGIIPALQAKKFDMIMSSMSITPERAKTINFSNMYYNSAAVIIGAKSDDKDFSPEHLKGKTIGVQVSTTHAAYLAKYYEPKGAVIKTYATQDEANADLAAGRLDYIMADGVALGAFLDSSQGGCCEQKGAVPIDIDILGPGVGFGIRKEDTALLDKVNKGIQDLANNGTFDKITATWKLEGKVVTPAKK
ncbi:MAG: transporter substrate-binding domain-containing protein [Alphaproteobacteria bacterium]|nr:transporter substrate-binding domain-containing protein [Alphaproteobacteria bacterium]